ncbi:uncharacterized protein SOCE26_076730 [Sorangium cellulosum]|uniref:Uncharacterized protein n=1 Tax=Sorangium cellulosum TaxID=56 RepID=A0A2L0F3K7_SORCE|nr:hypothetical protein [Sorangium cellulosum]AUX46168.1 uncharacterized protein SOCE26_076730 [Sorangium cellulosum]
MARDRGISLEEFARLRALLDSGQPKPEVLAAVGLDGSRWSEVEEAWLASLADDLERGESSSVRAFEGAYRLAWAERGGRHEAPATPLVDAVAGEPDAESDGTSTALLSAAAFSPREVLPFQRGVEQPRAVAGEERPGGPHMPEVGAVPDPSATQLLPGFTGAAPEEETLPLSSNTLLPDAAVPFRRAP